MEQPVAVAVVQAATETMVVVALGCQPVPAAVVVQSQRHHLN